MKAEEIKKLLKKYFDGESSLSEEQTLRNYFLSDDVDSELISYKELFAGFDELKTIGNGDLEDSVMDFILESEHQEKKKYRNLWQTVTGVAAIFLIALLVINYTNDRSTWKDTYSDPDIAYAEAKKAIHYMAGKYQTGLAELKPVEKFDNAIKPLNESIETVNKGFNELEKINNNPITTEP